MGLESFCMKVCYKILCYFQAKVERVVVDGVGRTKDDLVIKHVKPVLEAENFKDVCTKIFFRDLSIKQH